ncbi:Tim10/DDP family zinc finger-domain-containing protein [Hypomontagnella submonticulosa]|nr:Tim10/DDP family zinc finger-domain-containing protein [Hypomontagnella submonticulosa]
MESETVKSEVIKQVKAQYAIDNARQLIDKVNEHCFEKCVPKPGASLSSSEQTCFTQCMEKYMAAWNQVSATYIRRIQQEH